MRGPRAHLDHARHRNVALALRHDPVWTRRQLRREDVRLVADFVAIDAQSRPQPLAFGERDDAHLAGAPRRGRDRDGPRR